MHRARFLLTASILACAHSAAQPARESFDIFTFTPPQGFRKQTPNGRVVFESTDNQRRTWCQIAVYAGTQGKGSPDADFESEWRIYAQPLGVKAAPSITPVADRGSWKVRATSGTFSFQGKPALLVVTTYATGRYAASIVATSNAEDCLSHLEALLRSVELRKPDSAPPQEPPPPASAQPTPASAAGFTFTRTPFDDGWVSTATDGWAEVAKGGLKVLVHYPHPQADAHNFVLRDGDLNAWNLLVAPRYQNIRNFEWKSIQSFESISFLRADATERASGRTVHVVLFKKHSSKGNGRYLEFVAPNRAAYEAEFGPYHNDEFNWDRNANMQFRNKFAVSPQDLIGSWGASDYASLSYYYVSTGGFAGATATSTADQFTFLSANSYQSDHTGASGAVGNQRWSRQTYKGASAIRDWTLTLTNRFQGATESFNCYFEAIRGGRILLLTDRLGTTMSLVRQKR